MLVKDLFQKSSGGKIRPYFLHKFRKWAEQGAREDVFEWFGHKGLFGGENKQKINKFKNKLQKNERYKWNERNVGRTMLKCFGLVF
jgi:hypothetical protein